MADNLELFQIHSLVRKPETRVQRATSPDRHRARMMLGGGVARLVRARATVVSKELLMRLMPELKEKEARGMLKVTLMSGQRINLDTLQPLTEPYASPPLPTPPLDSAANDKTFEFGVGEKRMNVPGGKPLTEELPVPTVVEQVSRFDEPTDPEPVPDTVAAPVPEVEVEGEAEIVHDVPKPAVLETPKEEAPRRRRR